VTPPFTEASQNMRRHSRNFRGDDDVANAARGIVTFNYRATKDSRTYATIGNVSMALGLDDDCASTKLAADFFFIF